MFNPTSPEGHTAWDYAQSIVTLLHGLRQDVQQGLGDEPIVRRLPFSSAGVASGPNTFTFELPRGKSWQIIGYGVNLGATAGTLAVYVNEVGDQNLLLFRSTDGIQQIVSDSFADDGAQVTTDDLKMIVVVNNGISVPAAGNIRVRQYDSNPRDPKTAR